MKGKSDFIFYFLGKLWSYNTGFLNVQVTMTCPLLSEGENKLFRHRSKKLHSPLAVQLTTWSLFINKQQNNWKFGSIQQLIANSEVTKWSLIYETVFMLWNHFSLISQNVVIFRNISPLYLRMSSSSFFLFFLALIQKPT